MDVKYDSQTLVSGSARQLKAFKNELAQACTIDELKERIQEIVQELGFTNFLFVRPGRSWRTGSSHGLLHTLPDELMRIYTECGMYQDDLIIDYTNTNTQTIFSSQIYGYINEAPFDTELTQSNRELLQLYRRFNFNDHYAISLPASNGNGNVLLLLTASGLRQDEFREKTTPVMSLSRVLCQAIDLISTKKFSSDFIEDSDKRVRLTNRQREMLEALANGDKSISALADELSVSSVTAHQHISAARKALGVSTNIAAVVKALDMGLIALMS